MSKRGYPRDITRPPRERVQTKEWVRVSPWRRKGAQESKKERGKVLVKLQEFGEGGILSLESWGTEGGFVGYRRDGKCRFNERRRQM